MLNTVQGRRRVYNLSFVRSSLVGLSWTWLSDHPAYLRPWVPNSN